MIFSNELITTLQMWFFGLAKIPLIFYCKPKVISINDKSLVVKIKLNRRTRNHLKSMYFGVLSIGADLTGGFLAMRCIREMDYRIALIFKDFHADFIKRAEGDVHFVCNDGLQIRKLVKNVEKKNKRMSMPVNIIATVPAISPDPVAKFTLTLSLKKIP
tara:strand:- start:670 stop:1146 length:477 start_codon:yes stop_codon:yes gene_type:complete